MLVVAGFGGLALDSWRLRRVSPTQTVTALYQRLQRHGQRLMDGRWQVATLEEKETTRSPAPPFTTSTLQQEANRKLGLGARETMRIAQTLYENGHITYMRTDSVHLSDQAINAARRNVLRVYARSDH